MNELKFYGPSEKEVTTALPILAQKSSGGGYVAYQVRLPTPTKPSRSGGPAATKMNSPLQRIQSCRNFSLKPESAVVRALVDLLQISGDSNTVDFREEEIDRKKERIKWVTTGRDNDTRGGGGGEHWNKETGITLPKREEKYALYIASTLAECMDDLSRLA